MRGSSDAVPPGPFSLYLHVGRRAFRRFSTYRAATAAGVVTNTAFAFVLAYVLIAVAAQRPTVGGFTGAELVTFSFVREGLTVALGVFGPLELADRIPTGEIVADLYRPVDFQVWWLAQDAGRVVFQLAARALPVCLLGALVFRLRLPVGPGRWAAFAVTLVFAFGLSFAFRFIIALTGFWVLDPRGLNQLAVLTFGFLSGFLVPLALFPSGFRHVLLWSPFAAAVELPVDVFLGRYAGIGALATVWLRQAVWAAALLVLGRMVMARAWRRVVVQGG